MAALAEQVAQHLHPAPSAWPVVGTPVAPG
jgi:hypothetical protein